MPAWLAARLGLPYLSYAARIEPGPQGDTVRVRRISTTGYDLLEAPLPALVMGTQVLGEPRYPSLRGIMQARSQGDRGLVAGGPWPRGVGRGQRGRGQRGAGRDGTAATWRRHDRA